MTADADEEALTASVEIPASEMAGENKPDLKKAEAYLRRLLGAANLRVVDSKGSAEVHLGDEFAGVIRMDDRKAGVFELAILALDLEEASGAPGAPRAADKATDIEPVDSLNSTYFARTAQVAVRERPSEDAPIVTQFPEDQRVKVTGKLRNSSRSDERWYQIEFSDGTPRFVRGKDLLSEKTYRYKLQYKVLLNSYESNLQQIGNSQGKLARYMGFYTLGQDCQLQPFQVKKVKGFEGANALSQREKDVFWGSTSYALWTDGTHVFRSSVENGRMMRYKPTFINTKKYKNIGAIQLYRLDRIDPPGVDADLAVTGFAENGKLLVDVKLDGSNIQFKWATRCNDRSRVKDALAEHYKKAIEGLTIDF